MAKLGILCVGDLHFPWVSEDKLQALFEAAEERANARETRISHIIQMGDLYDMYAAAKFPRSHNVMTPMDEIKKGRDMAENFWHTIKTISPRAKCYQIRGNHDIRPHARLLEKAPELEAFFDPVDLWRFKGVKTISDPREELIINNIVFIHGYRSRLGQHAHHHQKSTVCGHSHRGGVVFMNLWGETIWELNAGYLGDPLSKPMSYPKQRFVNWTHGYGWIDDHGPRFCPL